jgi:glycosyltransferase involved in cell wall biosynthesis
LIDGYAKIAKKFPNSKLVIVGDGNEHKNLERQIKDLEIEQQAILIGRQKEIPKILKCSDIFVLPSRREAFGYVLLEAMVTHLPIIASQIGGIPEVVEDRKTGILFEPEDTESLSKAITSLLKDIQKRKQMGEAGHTRATQKFSAKVMAENYEKLYEKILS